MQRQAVVDSTAGYLAGGYCVTSGGVDQLWAVRMYGFFSYCYSQYASVFPICFPSTGVLIKIISTRHETTPFQADPINISPRSGVKP